MNEQFGQSLFEQLLTLLEYRESAHVSKDEVPLGMERAVEVEQFLDEIPGGFFIYRADNEQILYANTALLKIFGCNTMGEFRRHTGNSFRGIVYESDLESVEESIADQIAKSKDQLDYVEYRIVRRDGEIRWVEDYGHFVHSEIAGDIFYVFISDATDKIVTRIMEKQALLEERHEREEKIQSILKEHDKERQLIRQEELQRLQVIEALSANYDSIFYVDLDNDKVVPYRLGARLDGIFQRNFQVRTYTEFIKEYLQTWAHPEDAEDLAEKLHGDYIRRTLLGKKTYYMNYRCIIHGEAKYLQFRFVNVGETDRVTQVVIGCRNVDEEMIQELKQQQLLQDALDSAKLAGAAKDAFLSNMSHDMRTPLNAIFGFTELAKKNLANSGVALEYLHKIEGAGKHLLELVEQVLELTYMESQEFHNEAKECDLNEFFEAIIEEFAPKAEEKKINLFSSAQLTHYKVMADKEKLLQILSQLITNALKYTKAGGTVKFSVTEQTSTGGLTNFCFQISDTGIGIGKEFLPRIFEPFERERNTTLAGVYGTGLGLTITKNIVNKLGGTIGVESEENKGTTFTVTLPLAVLSDSLEHRGTKINLRGMRVLVVEDNELNLEIETELLEEAGFVVESAENGKVALDKLKAAPDGKFDFVLMDIQMPEMDGRTAAKEIRKLGGKKAQIPIVALSANAFESDRRLSLESGMNEHLTKPIDIAKLMETVSELLAH